MMGPRHLNPSEYVGKNRLKGSDILHISKRRNRHQKNKKLFQLCCLGILTGAVLLQFLQFANLKSSSQLITSDTKQPIAALNNKNNKDDDDDDTVCFKTVTNTGGFGNRMGVLMCAMGLVRSMDPSSKLIVLWNSANEGTPGMLVPTRARTGRGGYSIEAIQQLVNWPIEWVTETTLNATMGMKIDKSKNQSSPEEARLYSDGMEKDLRRWKNFFKVHNMTVVDEFEEKEQWWAKLNCHNLPTLHDGSINTNDYTPEPCFARYQAFGERVPQFSYLQQWLPNVTKQQFVDTLIETARQVTPNGDFCLPKETSYVVLHARRGDRSRTEHVQNIMELLEPLRSIASLYIISEDTALTQRLISDAQSHNLTTISASCTPDDLESRYRMHKPTLAMLQDYFAMTHSAGVITDFVTKESSFSTSAALGNGIAMLYPGNASDQHFMYQIAKSGNNGEPMRNVYFLNTIERFFEAVRQQSRAAPSS